MQRIEVLGMTGQDLLVNGLGLFEFALLVQCVPLLKKRAHIISHHGMDFLGGLALLGIGWRRHGFV
jgi:hypothetical protein